MRPTTNPAATAPDFAARSSLRCLRFPAVRALLIQVAAFPLTLAIVYLLASSGVVFHYWHVALVQGVVAALLSWWRGLASWWRAIQFGFPLALLGASGLAIPPAAFLAIFLFLLLLYWSTYRTQVPYYPSGRKVWAAVDAALPQGRLLRVIDIGSGIGGLVLELQRRRPESTIEGIELAPLPWLASHVRALLAQSGARFIRGDYEKLDLGRYDAVFAYLSPAAMGALWRKAAREMRPGSTLFSYEFIIEDRPPSRVVHPVAGGPALYMWDF
ncbi:bifunctional 2-polyprenyl-6-hydroxyphenol methylase/3-demethylubiquinol 3-O-methyltransferase UbiG [Massilia sp. HP4]|uniref:class I SAM-dependent methyltransferase n=1 Tax=Massilia sp. HP4 TaxID=2562316 RepID=UPI001484F074|nr:class I SAM-dependent methyltransferase [Massilia sp. HP4]